MLREILRISPEKFTASHGYELLRARLGGGEPRQSAAVEAEALVLYAYSKLLEQGSPARPAATAMADFRAHLRAFSGATMDALECSFRPDFQLLAQAHVKLLMQRTKLPWVRRGEARTMYAAAMRFGLALRQTEMRFQIDGSAGTFMPLPLEARLARKELEAAFAKSPEAPSGAAAEPPALAPVAPGAAPEDDGEAARRSFREVLARLGRNGQVRPNLATYFMWLGQFDPEAWSLMTTASPTLELAMRMQVDAIWGKHMDEAQEVATTPSDLIEAVMFGAWLHDAEFAGEEALSRHQQLACEAFDDF